ncbi:MAG: molecular chaperone HtpG [Bacteroidia bacterium]|jgi:molecular chaperone HtpG|nr:molecular chaperone HtpG [Bacteroidia bacterium]GIV22672.1 MAG: chaperone protein HtpG [Bacteroidia bacterium]
MRTGTLGVHLSGLLPIIRKYLYTHTDVFLRELIANGVDACQKLITIAPSEGITLASDEVKVEIFCYPTKRQLIIQDNGIGMTEEEVEKFLTVIAASSAKEFAEKYKETDIIGFFGMGFYSAFMVAEKVEVLTQSYKSGVQAVRWLSDGSETYTIEPAQRPQGRGTTITLHLSKEYEEYAQTWKVRQITEKYARFLPIPILVEGSPINQKPLWREQPLQVSEEVYKKFYKLLFPDDPEPVFYIHLNADYPVHLQGILYFPPLRPEVVTRPGTLSLYVRGMFITDELEGLIPEYFRLLHGVIESSDIPLNVSRSQLQVDPNLRKISQYIVRKVTEKLKEIYSSDRKRYESLWEHIGPFVKYGMVRDEDFARKARDLALVETTTGECLTLPEYEARISTVKNPRGFSVGFYLNDPAQHQVLAKLFEAKGYPIIKADTLIDPYWLSYIEREGKIRFARVDSEEAAKWLESNEKDSGFTLEEEKTIKEALERLTQLRVEKQLMGAEGPAALLLRDESQRRYQETLYQSGKNPPSRLVFNPQHPIYRRYLLTQDVRWLEHAIDWARLLSGDLTEETLQNFLRRDQQLLLER